jgi:hypothetical protein
MKTTREHEGERPNTTDAILLALVKGRLNEIQVRRALGLTKYQLDALLHERTEAGRVYCNEQIVGRQFGSTK